jgi:murein DD-endopeptidase MepM/ murein hydrolase activator NlpD
MVHCNNFETSKISRRFKRLMTRLAPYAAVASSALILWHAARDTPASVAFAPAPLIYPHAPSGGAAPTTPAEAAVQGGPAAQTGPLGFAQQASVGATIEVVVGRNDTLDAIFRRMALDTADLAAIRQLPGIRQSLDFLKPGDAIKLTHSDGEIKELTRKVSETQTLKVVRKDAGFSAKMIDNPVETRTRTATATIDSSLFQAAEAADISDMVALKLANVFAWDIDFVLDIREGDRFTVAYEQIYQDGKYLRDGEVLAAEFVNSGRVYRAVRFVADTGTAGYYTPEGLPMRKAFLRAPVEFTRVSSVFNPHRMHPILNRIRGHMGTDYAAPTGTPVHAAGDGRISFAGQRGGYGNAVVLAHSNSVSTLYGHMSRFAKHIRVGTHVQQGDVIGYVGMTGLATGPHLHYEYLVNGVHKNPQTVQLPGAEPLRADTLQKFRHLTAPLLADLSPQQAAAAANPPLTAEPLTAEPPTAGPLTVSPLTAGPLAAASAGPFADEPPAITVFSVSSVLNDSSSTSSDYRSPISIN